MSESDLKPGEPHERTDGERAALAAPRDSEQKDRSAQPARAGATPRVSGRSVALSGLAFVLALIAIAVTGMLWWQYRAFYVSLDQNDATAAAALERARAEQRALSDKLTELGKNVDALRQLNAGLTDRVAALPGRFADLERRLDAVQGGSFDARGELLRSEAEYYLTVANTQLTLAGDWDNAIKALELADGRLAELGNPELAPVRDSIAGELQMLRGVRLPDVEGLVFSLGRLAARAEQLPLRKEAPANYAARATPADDVEPGLGRLWFAIKQTLLGLVRVERRDSPVPRALSAAESALGRRQFAVEIELARIAALRREPQAFMSALGGAADRLRRDFDTDAAEVESALALLREMQSVDIAPKPPDIAGALNQLRAITSGSR